MGEQTFEWKSNRKKFFWILATSTALCLCIRIVMYLFSEDTNKQVVSNLFVPLFDNLSATFVVSLVVSMSYLFLKGKEEQIVLLRKSRIAEELEISRLQTSEWMFSGGTGSETRNVTIPFFANLGRDKFRTIKIQILDPRDISLCSKYARYRTRNHLSDTWTVRDVQLRIYSTIFACLYWFQKRQINIEVYFKNNFSTLRYDISEDRIIITKEDPEADAYLVKKPHSFYNAVLSEFRVTLDNSEWINIENCKGDFTNLLKGDETITKKMLSEQLKCIGIEEIFTDIEFSFIISNAKPVLRK